MKIYKPLFVVLVACFVIYTAQAKNEVVDEDLVFPEPPTMVVSEENSAAESFDKNSSKKTEANVSHDRNLSIEESEVETQEKTTDCAVCEDKKAPILNGKCPDAVKMPVVYESGDSIWELSSRQRHEFFYGRNLRLLNNCNPTDRIIVPGRSTWDLNFLYRFGHASHGYDVVLAKIVFRTRYTWGAADTNALTSFSSIKFLDSVIGEHNHPIPLNLPLIRELWVQFVLSDVFGVNLSHRHYVVIGFFPFQLGRGIALGDAYATAPDLLGYNPEFAVQQYAPGVKLSGELIPENCLTYDAYVAILTNKASTFDDVNAETRSQIFCHRNDQARGFGALNYVIAGRLKWMPFNRGTHKLVLEPYALFDNQREQRVEVLDDATSMLGTFGLALEYECGDFEFGFDSAFNVGHQKVKGLDRNIITQELRTGIPFFVNSNVIAIADNPATNDLAGKKAVDVAANQSIIDTSTQCANQNGQVISANLQNNNTRFRNPHTNHYKGKMFIVDAAYWLTRPGIKIAAAAGIATGDNDPNRHNNNGCDEDFEGFIGLQEVYSGTRVRSGFLLSGVGRIPRVLSFPDPDLTDERFPATVSRFTNIIFVGGAAWGKLQACAKTWDINPNILVYWQDHQAKVFENSSEGKSVRCASKFLGTELNVFIDTMLLRDLKFFFVAGIFIPGQHFKDIKGLPINKAQQRALERFDKTGIPNKVPLLGDDTAFFINTGLEYKF